MCTSQANKKWPCLRREKGEKEQVFRRACDKCESAEEPRSYEKAVNLNNSYQIFKEVYDPKETQVKSTNNVQPLKAKLPLLIYYAWIPAPSFHSNLQKPADTEYRNHPPRVPWVSPFSGPEVSLGATGSETEQQSSRQCSAEHAYQFVVVKLSPTAVPSYTLSLRGSGG